MDMLVYLLTAYCDERHCL